MFYTKSWRHGWIHASMANGVEKFEAQTPGLRGNTQHKTMHGAKMSLTRDWRAYCENPTAWKKANGEIIFNRHQMSRDNARGIPQ